jgi:hypothetical protein
MVAPEYFETDLTASLRDHAILAERGTGKRLSAVSAIRPKSPGR